MTTTTLNMLAAKSTEASQARMILEKKIAGGRAQAAGLFDRVMNQAPQDAIVRVGAIGWHGREAGIQAELPNGQVLGIHRHAMGQIAGRAGAPGAYLTDLSAGAGWQRELGAEILHRSFINAPQNERALLRSMGGGDVMQIRGFLSDRYRRLDSRPLLETFALSCQDVGAEPVEGVVSDTRVSMRALLPHVFEPVPGEALAIGVEWLNSDFGAARHSVRAFVLRLICLNGATTEDVLAQVHLGGRLSDDIQFSERTMELDTQASVSALKDVVRGTLGAPKVEAMLNGIRAANEKKVDWKSLKTRMAKKLLAGEMKEAEAAFNGEDVVMLPAGSSMWRASNALSWLANKAEDPDRKLEMQRLAGELMTGKADSAASS